MTKKDEKIIKNSEAAEIPIFVLTAKDHASVAAIREYYNECETLNCNSDHLWGIRQRMEEFQKWQRENIDLVKIPD